MFFPGYAFSFFKWCFLSVNNCRNGLCGEINCKIHRNTLTISSNCMFRLRNAFKDIETIKSKSFIKFVLLFVFYEVDGLFKSLFGDFFIL